MTPRNLHVLGTRIDNWVVNDVMTLSVQSVALVASMGPHLIVKSYEVQVLRAQLVVEDNLFKIIKQSSKN